MTQQQNSLIGTEWKCGRCGSVVIVDEAGIDHASNDNGPHYTRYSLLDLLTQKLFMDRQVEAILYGRRDDAAE